MRPRPVSNPPNPWSATHTEYLEEIPAAALEVFEDRSRSILSRNDSPDVGFTWSVNPYRGCAHACAYCYARPTHEYLGYGAGTDFDRKIVVKPRAPELLRAALAKKGWRREPIAFSGVTDCYQPLEASYRLTRGCLEACLDARNPVGVITKAPLIERDIDLLRALHAVAEVEVAVSIPIWDPEAARAIEPMAATPQRRIKTIARLAAAGLRVGVNVAPLIPGLSDDDVPRILGAARDAGATSAGCALLRLPGPVAVVFAERLRAAAPLRADKVLGRVRQMRSGKLNDPRFGTRGTGEGPYAEALRALFHATAGRLGLSRGRAGELGP